MIDLLFPVLGDTLPTDHAYLLYAALSRVIPAVHDPTTRMRFAPVTGEPVGAGRLRITDRSLLRLRLPAEQIATALPLAGRRIEVGSDTVRFGTPRVTALTPATSLIARIVTLKHNTELMPFLARATEKLTTLGVQGEVSVPLTPDGPRKGQPLRRVARVKGKCVVGFAMVVEGLSANDSIRLQEQGLGGRTRIGCGFFLPVRGK